FTMGRARPRDDNTAVSTVVERPYHPPTNVDWIISNASGEPRIIDVIAEGTSLRLTQRQDYASYLNRNNNDIDALINAMSHQVAQPGYRHSNPSPCASPAARRWRPLSCRYHRGLCVRRSCLRAPPRRSGAVALADDQTGVPPQPPLGPVRGPALRAIARTAE